MQSGNGKTIGYARVSTDEQHLDLQLSALNEYGCAAVYTDKGVSGSRFDRPGLLQALNALTPGSTLVVWRLDRLGRSLNQLASLIDALSHRKVCVVSMTEYLDTRSCSGRFVFHMLSALAEFERGVISERTRAGMAVARAQGRRVGRPPALTLVQLKEASKRLETQPMVVVASALNVHHTTLRRHLRKLVAVPVKSSTGNEGGSCGTHGGNEQTDTLEGCSEAEVDRGSTCHYWASQRGETASSD